MSALTSIHHSLSPPLELRDTRNGRHCARSGTISGRPAVRDYDDASVRTAPLVRGIAMYTRVM
jgi:hypothetical protein